MLCSSLPAQNFKQEKLQNIHNIFFRLDSSRWTFKMKVTKNCTTCKPNAHKTLENHWIWNKNTKRNLKQTQNSKPKQIEALMRKGWEQGKERRYLSWSSQSAPFASDFQAGKISHTRIDMSMMCMWNFGFKRFGGWRLAAFALGAPACLTGFSTVSGVNPLSGLLSSCWVRTVELWSRLSLDLRNQKK